jgi:transcriptional regulator with XRE-family HTH domain
MRKYHPMKKSYRKSPEQLKRFKILVNNALSTSIQIMIAESKLSKHDFAKLVKKTPSTVSRWLTTEHNFSIETLCEISFYTRIPIHRMLSLYALHNGYASNPKFTELCEKV